MNMKYFRVKYGYGKNDFHSITEDELPKAVKAHGNGGVAVFSSGTVSGNNIIAITPDYHRLMGYNPEYELTGEDMLEIGRKTIQEHQDALLVARGETPTKPKEISEGVKRLATGMTKPTWDR